MKASKTRTALSTTACPDIERPMRIRGPSGSTARTCRTGHSRAATGPSAWCRGVGRATRTAPAKKRLATDTLHACSNEHNQSSILKRSESYTNSPMTRYEE